MPHVSLCAENAADMNCTLVLLIMQTSIHIYVFVAIDRFEVDTSELQHVEEVGLACLLCLWTAIHVLFWNKRRNHQARRAEQIDDVTTASQETRIFDKWVPASELDDTSSIRSGVSNVSRISVGFDDD